MQTMTTGRLAAQKIFIVGMALFAAQFTWVVYNTYIPLFLQAGSAEFDALRNSSAGQMVFGFGLSAVQTGLIMSLDNLAALLLQPLTGILSDRTWTRIGRRLPYLLAGMPLAALGMAILPLLLPGSKGQQTAAFIPFMGLLLVLVVAMAIWRAPVFALMADLTPSSQRSKANGILNLMAGLGGVLAFMIGSLLYSQGRPLPFWAAAFLLSGGCLLIVASVREPARLPVLDQARPALIGSLRTWLRSLPPDRQQSLFFLTMAVFCYMVGFHPIEAFFSSYAVSVLKLSEASSGLVLSAAYIAFILAAVPAGMLSEKIGRKRTVFVGLILFALALLAAYFIPVTAVLVGLMALGGAGWALVDINAFTMVLDIAPGRNGAEPGTAAGVYFIATTLAAIVGPVLNGWLIDLSGRNYSTIFLIGPAFLALALILVGFVRHGEVG